MSKFLLSACFLTATSTVFAAPVDCLAILAPVGANTMQTLLNTNAGGGCYHQDKIFSNFVYTGSNVPADQIDATHQYFVGAQPIHGFVFGSTGGFTSAFTIGYTVNICQSSLQGCAEPNALARLIAFKGQINSGMIPNGSVFSGTVSPGGPFTLSGASTTTEGTQLATGAVTAATVSGSFNGVGNLASVELDFFQTTVPEPTTAALIASGLFGLGFARHRSRAR